VSKASAANAPLCQRRRLPTVNQIGALPFAITGLSSILRPALEPDTTLFLLFRPETPRKTDLMAGGMPLAKARSRDTPNLPDQIETTARMASSRTIIRPNAGQATKFSHLQEKSCN